MVDERLIAVVKAITSVFETDSPRPKYDYIEDLGDGRGFTVTSYGFTEHDELPELCRMIGGVFPRTLATERFRFAELWRMAARHTDSMVIANACETLANREFLYPAVTYADSDFRRTDSAYPVALAIYFDTVVQHGDGLDHDGFPAIREQALSYGAGKMQLETFLATREAVLSNPTDPETRDVWRASRSRIAALRRILATDPALRGPLFVEGHRINGLGQDNAAR
jgi:hypothetical protein